MPKNVNACDVLRKISLALREFEGHFSGYNSLDTEMLLDGILDHLAQCIPAADFEKLTELRLNGYESSEEVIDCQTLVLLRELKKSHQIIKNALNIMTIPQKHKWGKANDRDNVSGEDVTRANEREAVILKAREGL